MPGDPLRARAEYDRKSELERYLVEVDRRVERLYGPRKPCPCCGQVHR